MKHYLVRIMYKRIKKVPPKIICIWILLTFLLIYCIFQLCFPMNQAFEDFQECEITIDHVNLWDSHGTKGSRMKLEIVSEQTTYYVWYPKTKYAKFADAVEKDLLSRNVTMVKVRIAANQSMRDYIFNQKRVVDIRSSSAVYYDPDTEMISIRQQRISLWVLFLIVLVLWLCFAIFVSLIYRIFILEKKQVDK